MIINNRLKIYKSGDKIIIAKTPSLARKYAKSKDIKLIGYANSEQKAGVLK